MNTISMHGDKFYNSKQKQRQLKTTQHAKSEEDNKGLGARKPVYRVCEQQKRRPACASAQSDQRICFSLNLKYHF